MPSDQDLEALLVLACDSARRIAQSLRYQPRDPRQLFAVALFLTLIDYGDAVLGLRGRSGAIAIPSITRASLDAYVDIENLSKDRGYYEFLLAADDWGWKRILDRAEKGGNPFLRAIEEDKSLVEAGRKLHGERIEKLSKRGIRKLKEKERYDRAGCQLEYESVYGALSADVHNSISAVISRHFEVDENGEHAVRRGQSQMRFDKACVLSVAEAVIRASEILLRMCRHGSAQIADARGALDGLEQGLPRTVS